MMVCECSTTISLVVSDRWSWWIGAIPRYCGVRDSWVDLKQFSSKCAEACLLDKNGNAPIWPLTICCTTAPTVTWDASVFRSHRVSREVFRWFDVATLDNCSFTAVSADSTLDVIVICLALPLCGFVRGCRIWAQFERNSELNIFKIKIKQSVYIDIIW